MTLSLTDAITGLLSLHYLDRQFGSTNRQSDRDWRAEKETIRTNCFHITLSVFTSKK
jgi:hypothetical protein